MNAVPAISSIVVYNARLITIEMPRNTNRFFRFLSEEVILLVFPVFTAFMALFEKECRKLTGNRKITAIET